MNLRMDKAKGLLKKGYKVYEVSEMVGYNNHRYFTDIFKKVYRRDAKKLPGSCVSSGCRMKKVVFREEIEKNILCFREKSAVYISVFRDIIKKSTEKRGMYMVLSVKYTISFWNGKIIGRGIGSVA